MPKARAIVVGKTACDKRTASSYKLSRLFFVNVCMVPFAEKCFFKKNSLIFFHVFSRSSCRTPRFKKSRLSITGAGGCSGVLCDF